ncbi:NAD-dependent epimerase/dehydratase family protein [Actinomadura gamaensis]|uniref:NAD-dependent epimerase/dehydratase family protein n=1 Tax=Actinomadura gamaensis TaxID=1763541 RepID=A0ABV9U2Z5_9ACTN
MSPPGGGRRVVVGAAGFIGARLLDRLAREDRTVGAVTRGTPLVTARGPHPDVRDAEIVYYLATSVNPAIAEDRPDLVAADRAAFERLLDALAGFRRPPLVVLTGSGGAVYDPDVPPPYDERTTTRPRSAYGRAKLELESALRARAPAVPGLVLRLGNVYGPGQRTGTGQGVLAHWLRSIADRRPLRIYGDTAALRDYVYVDDVVDALVALRPDATPAPVLNIGSGEGVSLQTLLEVIRSVVGAELVLETRPARAFDRRDVALDIRLAASELGWRPRTTLAEGVALTWRELAARVATGANRGSE